MIAIRILIVSPVYPLPLTTGTRVRLYNLTRQFQDLGHEVGLISFVNREEEPFVEKLSPLLREQRLVRTGRKASPLRKLRRLPDALPFLLRGVPRQAAFAAHAEIRSALEELAPSYDVILVEFYFMGFNISQSLWRTCPEKFILTEHDISFIPLRRTAAVTPWPGRLRALIAYAGGRLAETTMLRRFPTIAAMSGIDEGALQAIAPNSRIILVPNGVDCRKFTPQPRPSGKTKPRLLFVGGMGHYPNLDAVSHCIRDILPLLRRRLPGIRFLVAGDTAGADLSSLSGEGVTFLGFVPDLKELYASSLAMACPFRIGGGTRLKILEGMASGIPIISTSTGAEGIPVEHGQHALLADAPEAFCQAVLRLHDDQKLAQELSRNGRVLVERFFDWQAIAASFMHYLHKENRYAPDPEKTA